MMCSNLRRWAALDPLAAKMGPDVFLWRASALAALGILFLAGQGAAMAASIPIPNGSFESPIPPPGYPATPFVDEWQKPPAPAWFNPETTGGIAWEQLSGVFPNTAAGSPDHIDNMDGNQAAYLFTLPEVALVQRLESTFEVGQSYQLTVGALGGGGIAEGSGLALSLYYLDGASRPVAVSTSAITYTQAQFPTATHLVDIGVKTPAVQTGDPWAGQNIGVQILATSGMGAGYWDLDNVRLEAVPEPAMAAMLALGLAGIAARRWRIRRHG